MPFKQVFERRVNRDMQEEEAGPAPREEDAEDLDMKKAHDEKEPQLGEEQDVELSEKKDRPPRFSTLFEGTPAPQIIERQVEPRRKSGVYIPMPLFIVLALALFFESTLLFAYTVIGLYNNLPNGILPFGGSSSTTVEGCNCADSRQAGINIAPNFYLPGAHGAVSLSVSSAPSSKMSSSTSSSTSNNSKYLESLLAALTTTTSSSANLVASTTKVIVTTPTRKIVKITSDETVIAGQLTSTSFTTVPPKSSTNAKRASPASESASAGNGQGHGTTTTPSTLVTSTSPPATAQQTSRTKDKNPKPTTTTTSNGVACFGAGGAVWQNCVTVR